MGFVQKKCDYHGLIFDGEVCPICAQESYIFQIKKAAYKDGFREGIKYGTKNLEDKLEGFSKKKPYWVENCEDAIFIFGRNGFMMESMSSYTNASHVTQQAKRLAKNLGLEYRGLV